jgi:hypothetical protein
MTALLLFAAAAVCVVVAANVTGKAQLDALLRIDAELGGSLKTIDESVCDSPSTQTDTSGSAVIGFRCLDSSIVSLSLQRLCGGASTLPTTLFELTGLTELRLDSGDLVGTLPSRLFTLTNLEYLSIPNQNFTGTVPTEIQRLTKLKQLLLFGNMLVGPLTLTNLTALYTIYVSDTQLDALQLPPSVLNCDAQHTKINCSTLTRCSCNNKNAVLPTPRQVCTTRTRTLRPCGLSACDKSQLLRLVHDECTVLHQCLAPHNGVAGFVRYETDRVPFVLYLYEDARCTVRKAEIVRGCGCQNNIEVSCIADVTRDSAAAPTTTTTFATVMMMMLVAILLTGTTPTNQQEEV